MDQSLVMDNDKFTFEFVTSVTTSLCPYHASTHDDNTKQEKAKFTV
jgi:hypothetical protein